MTTTGYVAPELFTAFDEALKNADVLGVEPKALYRFTLHCEDAKKIKETLRRIITVFDWAYTDAGRMIYAGTPERASELIRKGIKLTPVFTIEDYRS